MYSILLYRTALKALLIFLSSGVLLCSLLFPCRLPAQSIVPYKKDSKVFEIKNLPPEGILLNEGWKFHKGDSAVWANPQFDDSQWEYINPTKDAGQYYKLLGNKIAWLRLSLLIDSSLTDKSIVLRIQQNVASEIFLDGKLVTAYGTFASDSSACKAYNPIGHPLPVQFSAGNIHELAIRICLPAQSVAFKYPRLSNNFLKISVSEWAQSKQYIQHSLHPGFGMSFLKGGMFTVLFFLHFALYFFYRRQKVNLYFGLFNLFSAAVYILYALLTYRIHDVQISNLIRIPGLMSFPLSCWFLLQAIYTSFNEKRGGIFWLLFAILIFLTGLYFTHLNQNGEWIINLQVFYFPVLVSIECLRVAFLSFKKNKGSRVNKIAPYMILNIFCLVASLVATQTSGNHSLYSNIVFEILINAGVISFPACISMFVALEFSFYSRKLLKAQELRNRIALDLHDDLGTKLSTVRMFMSSLKNNPDKNETALLDNSLHLLDTSISDLRQIMNELQTSLLQQKGYIAATEELVNRVNHFKQITFTLTHNGIGKRLEQKTEYNLFRITQELINNTLKYANAKNITVNLLNRDGKIIFMYEDDGDGFNTSLQQKGYGLANIISRSQSLSGSVEFDSMPGTGFRTIIELPLIYA